MLQACPASWQATPTAATLVEFNASKRALETIDNCHYLEGEEYNGAKKVLTAAALTYVAALTSALATLLRLFLIINRGNRN